MADKKTKAPAKKPPAKAPSSRPKASRPPRKAATKEAKASTGVPRKPDRRGTPKGKGVVAGRRGGGKIGNPKFEPTEDQRLLVLSHAAVATPYAIIAEELGISESTLTKYFGKELEQGLPRANSRLGGVVYKKALAGDLKAAEMWWDRRGGSDWRKKTGVELSGVNGKPIETRDVSKLTDAQLDALASLDDDEA